MKSHYVICESLTILVKQVTIPICLFALCTERYKKEKAKITVNMISAGVIIKLQSKRFI